MRSNVRRLFSLLLAVALVLGLYNYNNQIDKLLM